MLYLHKAVFNVAVSLRRDEAMYLAHGWRNWGADFEPQHHGCVVWL